MAACHFLRARYQVTPLNCDVPPRGLPFRTFCAFVAARRFDLWLFSPSPSMWSVSGPRLREAVFLRRAVVFRAAFNAGGQPLRPGVERGEDNGRVLVVLGKPRGFFWGHGSSLSCRGGR